MGLFDRIFSADTVQGNHSGSVNRAGISWKTLDSFSGLDALVQRSHQSPVLLFKHSTRCSVSSMALNLLESNWVFPEDQLQPWFLDLISFREVSHKVAADLGVEHQSPQAIVIHGGKVIYHASHSAISVAALQEALSNK